MLIHVALNKIFNFHDDFWVRYRKLNVIRKPKHPSLQQMIKYDETKDLEGRNAS